MLIAVFRRGPADGMIVKLKFDEPLKRIGASGIFTEVMFDRDDHPILTPLEVPWNIKRQWYHLVGIDDGKAIYEYEKQEKSNGQKD